MVVTRLVRDSMCHCDYPAVCERIEIVIDFFRRYMFRYLAAPDKINWHEVWTSKNIMKRDRDDGPFHIDRQPVDPMSHQTLLEEEVNSVAFAAAYIQYGLDCKSVD